MQHPSALAALYYEQRQECGIAEAIDKEIALIQWD
jgi:hypothetical protein